jgi:hypothetical protein
MSTISPFPDYSREEGRGSERARESKRDGDIPASFPCINWNVPIFLLNCSLVWVYSRVRSRAACMILPVSYLIPSPPQREREEEVHTLMAHRLGLASRDLIPTSIPQLLLRLYPIRFLIISPSPLHHQVILPSGISTLSKNNSAVGDPRIYHQHLPISNRTNLRRIYLDVPRLRTLYLISPL